MFHLDIDVWIEGERFPVNSLISALFSKHAVRDSYETLALYLSLIFSADDWKAKMK